MILMRMTGLCVAGQGNRHYIRLLLCHAKGATCFHDLKVFEGHAYITYKEACAARGLLDDDKMHDEILADAILHQMPRQLRHTFAILLLWDEPTNPCALWEKYKLHMAEDFLHRERQVSGAIATVVWSLTVQYKQCITMQAYTIDVLCTISTCLHVTQKRTFS